MLLYLGSGGHGDRSARLFGGHKSFYNGQRLTIILSAGFWLVKITNLLSKQNIAFASNVDWKKKFTSELHYCVIARLNICWMKIHFCSCRTNVFIQFHHFKEKQTPAQVFSCGICETFKNSGGCFWKHVTLHNKKLVIFNAVLLLLLLLLLLRLLLTRWWDMRLKHDVVWNEKKYCSCCIILIRIETILSKNIKNNFQNLLFKKLLAKLGNHILEVLLACRHFGRPKLSDEC